MSARSQVTLCDHGGGSGEAVTEDQMGSPERLGLAGVRQTRTERGKCFGDVPDGCYIPASFDCRFTYSRP